MDEFSTLVVGEARRLGDIASMAVFGEVAEQVASEVNCAIQVQPFAELFDAHALPESAVDFVVAASAEHLSELQRRTLAHRLAGLSRTAVLVARPFGSEIPVPLVEVKRGLMADAVDVGYRVHGRRA